MTPPPTGRQEPALTDPTVLIVPGAGVYGYARPAVDALRARGRPAQSAAARRVAACSLSQLLIVASRSSR